MRIMIKGGVWKNTEDEILKVAVMKYGLNQWSRISSLLVRKSAKQCKARWYEWLDPSIRKTEWTREEDEKLLHLAKLMPCQWRTIAPIVGRTPTQCLDRYEKLLDMAVSKEDRYDPSDDPRRLRPGEIDPNPESKPARPDAIDMEEDEKEMLSEARARLANTRGKKAKRKAREKQLEEARRLASLQKKRELKAAGIEQRGKFKKRGGVDYSSEVAFEKKPASGFFDTTQEDGRSKELQLEFRPVTVEELEGKRRKDVEEALIKKDIKKAKLNESHNPLAAIAKQQEDNDPAMLRRRTKMMLPAPQVSEAELEAIARMSTEAEMMPEVADGAGGDATRQLLGQYGPMPSRAPARTPRTAATGDRLMMDAQNLARMTAMATPLLGGANPELHPSDFSGATPRSAVPATPNPLSGSATPRGGNALAITATPTIGGSHGARSFALAGVSATPSMFAGTPLRGNNNNGGNFTGNSMMSSTPMRTPLRDELGLNDSSMYGGGEGGSRRAEAQRAAALRAELRGALGSLPAPANEYVFAAPALPEDEGEGGEGMEEDAADGKARRAREAEEARMVLERKKSTVLQRGLPRPLSLDALRLPKPAHELAVLSLRERAEETLYEEYYRLLTHDALAYPVQTRDRSEKKSNKRSAPSVPLGPAPPLEDIPLEALQAAAALIKEEAAFLVRSMGHEAVAPEEYADVASAVSKDLLYLPSKGRYERLASATPTERTEALKAEFDSVRDEMDREAKKGARMESKVALLLGGLVGRGAKMQEATKGLWEEGLDLHQKLTCFKELKQRELRIAPNRIEALTSLVSVAQQRERTLQDSFKALTQQRDQLLQECQSELLQSLRQPRSLPA